MATGSPTPLRQVLEERVKQLVADTENLFAEARERARREVADQLNQAVRRIRQTASVEDLGATLLDSTAPFCASAALFSISGEVATGQRIRGVTESVAHDFCALQVALISAPALASAVHSRDPVIAVTTAGEVSEALVRLFAHLPGARASIYPLVERDRVPALLYTWEATSGAAIELLAQVASAAWSGLAEPPFQPLQPAAGLVRIGGLGEVEGRREPTSEAGRPSAWDRLPPDEQRIHLRAQRFARVRISEMQLYEPAAVQSGRHDRNLYDTLRVPIDKARETFRSNFFRSCPTMVDYLHLELVRTLAKDDAELLGAEYPGPLL